MEFKKTLLEQRIYNFSKNRYELMFSIFMFIAAIFLKSNPMVKYPEVLYPLFFLMFLNFAVNRYIKEKDEINALFFDLVSAANSLVVYLILSLSGGADSMLWVMFLLPVFSAGMTGSFIHFNLICFFSALCLFSPYTGYFRGDFLMFSGFFIKAGIIYGGGLVVFRSALARKALENEIVFKRLQAQEMMKKLALSKISVPVFDPAEDGAKAEFLATALHDVKNIITVVYLTAQIIDREENFNRTDFKRLYGAAKMAANLSRYGLLAAKNGGEMELAPVELGGLITETINLLEYKTLSRNISIETELPDSPVKIEACAINLQRVFINLVSNSVSLLAKNGKIKIALSVSGKRAVVTVSDNGPGFPVEILQRIEPFKSARVKSGGIGLGLFSSLEIIKKHKGEFFLKNPEEGGAEVRIVLPLAGQESTV